MNSEPPPIELNNKKRKAAEILEKHACALPYESADLQLIDGFVYEPTWSTVVSDDLLGRMFPKLGPTEVVHFTKPDTLPSILEKKQLWLATVAKNFATEYIAFLTEHAYAAAKSKQIRRELAECYFYASFTVPGSGSEASHWSTFADGGTGYRLRLQLSPRAADLREIRYERAKTISPDTSRRRFDDRSRLQLLPAERRQTDGILFAQEPGVRARDAATGPEPDCARPLHPQQRRIHRT